MWKPVPGWPGLEVSDAGRVRQNGKLVPTRTAGEGYVYTNAKRRGRRETVAVHVLVCRAFHGRRPTCRHIAAHKNGVRSDPRARNVRWATHSENEADKVLHGTDIRGEKHPGCRLTRELVRWLRKRYAKGGVSYRDLGRALGGIGASTIGKAITGRSWGWLK